MIGAGAMGGATVEGLIKGDYFRNEDITVADPSQKVIDKFAQMGLAVTRSALPSSSSSPTSLLPRWLR